MPNEYRCEVNKVLDYDVVVCGSGFAGFSAAVAAARAAKNNNPANQPNNPISPNRPNRSNSSTAPNQPKTITIGGKTYQVKQKTTRGDQADSGNRDKNNKDIKI